MDGDKQFHYEGLWIMATKTEMLLAIAERYMDEHNVSEVNPREIASWAIRKGLWEPEPSAMITQCAEQLSRAFRDEVYTDPQGRKARRMYVVVTEKNGELFPKWTNKHVATHDFMVVSFQQTRRRIVDDCVRLKTDIDSYNENENMNGEPIQTSFNFTRDVEEKEIAKTILKTSANGSKRRSAQSGDALPQTSGSRVTVRP